MNRGRWQPGLAGGDDQGSVGGAQEGDRAGVGVPAAARPQVGALVEGSAAVAALLVVAPVGSSSPGSGTGRMRMPVDQSPGLPGAGGTRRDAPAPRDPRRDRRLDRRPDRRPSPASGVVVVPVTQVDPVAVVDAEDLGADGAVGVVGLGHPVDVVQRLVLPGALHHERAEAGDAPDQRAVVGHVGHLGQRHHRDLAGSPGRR